MAAWKICLPLYLFLVLSRSVSGESTHAFINVALPQGMGEGRTKSVCERDMTRARGKYVMFTVHSKLFKAAWDVVGVLLSGTKHVTVKVGGNSLADRDGQYFAAQWRASKKANTCACIERHCSSMMGILSVKTLTTMLARHFLGQNSVSCPIYQSDRASQI